MNKADEIHAYEQSQRRFAFGSPEEHEMRRVDKFLSDVRDEVVRSRAKFPSNDLILVATGEEFGELFRAALDEPTVNVYKEAVQVAGMALRVAIDGDSSVVELRKRRGLGPLETR